MLQSVRDESTGNYEVICITTDTETLEWSIISPTLEWNLMIENSSEIELYHGLTVNSVVTMSLIDPELTDITSWLVFDSSFPLTGHFSCTCTVREMYNLSSSETTVLIRGESSTSKSPSCIIHRYR